MKTEFYIAALCGTLWPGAALTQDDDWAVALRTQIQRCWTVGALTGQAKDTSVTVQFELDQSGVLQTETIRLTDPEDGTPEHVQQAYEAARRAIVRCGTNGYELPKDRFEDWQSIDMTFNPENMRIK